MELKLNRIISTSKGTNGVLELDVYNKPDIEICKTIELPWKQNATGVSCVPPGRYELMQRHTDRFGDHLILIAVPHRSLILIHPANDALKELRGCIAPVSSFNGAGNGNASRAALAKLMSVVKPAFQKREEVWITIK